MIVILIELSPSFEFVQAYIQIKLYQNSNCFVILLKYATFQQLKLYCNNDDCIG